MLVQIDLDQTFCVAYDIIARSHGVSRRQYITEFLMRAAEEVPGLMDRVKGEMYGEKIEQRTKADVIPVKNILIPDTPSRRKRYRFVKFTEEVFEGVGTAAGEALKNATGRSWTSADYDEEFRAPEFLGYEGE